GGRRQQVGGGVFFFQAEDGIRDFHVTGVQTCALPILLRCVWNFAAPPPGGRDALHARTRAEGRALLRQGAVTVGAVAASAVAVEIGRASCREGGWGGAGAGWWDTRACRGRAA